MITPESIKKACSDLADLLIKKNHDYGNSVEEQFKEYGMNSILIRLDDKTRRLKTLKSKEGQVVSESTKDTLQDLAGYAILGLLCLNDEPVVTGIISREEYLKLNPIFTPSKTGIGIEYLKNSPTCEIHTTEEYLKNKEAFRKHISDVPEHVKNYGKHGQDYVSEEVIAKYFDQDDQH